VTRLEVSSFEFRVSSWGDGAVRGRGDGRGEARMRGHGGFGAASKSPLVTRPLLPCLEWSRDRSRFGDDATAAGESGWRGMRRRFRGGGFDFGGRPRAQREWARTARGPKAQARRRIRRSAHDLADDDLGALGNLWSRGRRPRPGLGGDFVGLEFKESLATGDDGAVLDVPFGENAAGDGFAEGGILTSVMRKGKKT